MEYGFGGGMPTNVSSLDPKSLMGSGQKRHIPKSSLQFGPGGSMPQGMQLGGGNAAQSQNRLGQLLRNYDQGPVGSAMGNVMGQNRQDRVSAMQGATGMSPRSMLNQGVGANIGGGVGQGMQQDMKFLGAQGEARQDALGSLLSSGNALEKFRGGNITARQGLRDSVSDMNQKGHGALLDYEAGKALEQAQRAAAEKAKRDAKGKMMGTLLGTGVGAAFGGPGGAAVGANLGGQLF